MTQQTKRPVTFRLALALGQAESRCMRANQIRGWLGVAVLAAGLVNGIAGERAAKPETPEARQARFFKAFESTLTNTVLIGKFTITGKQTPPSEESYTIRSVKKMAQGDYWLFTARIKYGKRDVTLPIPIPVKWAGDTPVISLDNLTLPGLGTFSAHVVIDGDKYAGTWAHGKVGGHMFGTIAKVKPESAASSPQKKPE
ncbi:MAG: hypothetical protein QF721_10560 [Verrucomicrobiota bacterium]|nr:hypothetical protein [Verrucomicrobiota bacterium]MDP7049884.1 hypothetical protein [Verrucomicrobiota bacterium]